MTDYVDYKASRRMDRFTHLALAAARQAETGCRARDRAGGRAGRRRGRDRDRRPQVVRGLHPGRSTRAAPTGQPVLDRPDHPEPRRRLGLDGARDEGAVAVGVHGLRRVEHGDRGRLDAGAAGWGLDARRSRTRGGRPPRPGRAAVAAASSPSRASRSIERRAAVQIAAAAITTRPTATPHGVLDDPGRRGWSRASWIAAPRPPP